MTNGQYFYKFYGFIPIYLNNGYIFALLFSFLIVLIIVVSCTLSLVTSFFFQSIIKLQPFSFLPQ